METISCRYTVVKYLPQPKRDECVNIGVILQATDRMYIACRFLDSFAKVKSLDPLADLRLLREFSLAFKKALEPGHLIPSAEAEGRMGNLDPRDPQILDFLAAEYEGRFRFTEPRGTLVEQLDQELETLYTQFVEAPPRPIHPISSVVTSPSNLRKRLIRAFDKRGLLETGAIKAEFQVEGRTYPWIFDLGFKNGRLNVIQSLALDVKEPDQKLKRALIVRGMVEDTRSANNGQDVEATVVFRRPADDSRSGLDSSLDLLEEARIHTRSIETIDALAAEFEREICARHA